MKSLKIEETKSTPKVVLSPIDGEFIISGRSIPDDAAAFYTPIIEWLNEYIETPEAKTVFHFKMNYFNTATSKFFLNILYKLEKVLNKGNDVLVKWYHDSEDEDMAEAGESYSEVIDIPLELVAY
jgi:hypothetical protein